MKATDEQKVITSKMLRMKYDSEAFTDIYNAVLERYKYKTPALPRFKAPEDANDIYRDNNKGQHKHPAERF